MDLPNQPPQQPQRSGADRVEAMDFADRWVADGFRAIEPLQAASFTEVDMSRSQTILERLRERGVRATYNHLVVRATALTLKRHPEIHFLLAGTKRHYPGRVDIGLSVAGDSFYAPVLILEDAGEKPLPVLADEITRRAPELREQARRDAARIRRWGWLIPFGFLRRALLRLLFSFAPVRRKAAGTFQISCVPGVDAFFTLLATTSACLSVGGVRDRVVAVGGRAEVRPTVVFGCNIDHKAWDGTRVVVFQTELKRILESGELESEIPT